MGRLAGRRGRDEPVEAEPVGADPQVAEAIFADGRDRIAAEARRVADVVAELEHGRPLPIGLACGIEDGLVQAALIRADPQDARSIFEYALQAVSAEAARVLRVVRKMDELDGVTGVGARKGFEQPGPVSSDPEGLGLVAEDVQHPTTAGAEFGGGPSRESG